jgi:hypothetical protein
LRLPLGLVALPLTSFPFRHHFYTCPNPRFDREKSLTLRGQSSVWPNNGHVLASLNFSPSVPHPLTLIKGDIMASTSEHTFGNKLEHSRTLHVGLSKILGYKPDNPILKT